MSSRTKTPLHLLARVGHEALLKQYLQTIDAHAIVSLSDMHGTILHANDLFCQISGYNREELIGSNHRIVKSGHHPSAFYEEMWCTISSGRVWQGEICNRCKNGDLYWVKSTIMPFLDETGLPCRYLSIRTDITAQKKIVAKLKEQEDRLSLSRAYANIGTWDWNIQTGEIYWSDRIASLFGLDDRVETTYDNFLRAVHPEDRQIVIDAVYACMERGEEYDIEHRVVRPDGTVHWMLERGGVTRDAAGKPLHMLGVVQDITRRMESELALRESESRLQESQRISRLGHWSADFRTGEVLWSEEVYQIFGQNPQEFLPTIKNFNSVVHPDDREALRKSEHLALKNGIHDVVHRVLRPDGAPCWVRELAEMRLDDTGAPVQMVGTVQDITALKQAEQALIAARDAAMQANRAKSEFLSSMSHELRTPMNAILGFSQLLEIDPALSTDQRESVHEILKAGRHLLELINDVLDLSRIEAGKIELSPEPISGHDMLDECADLMEVLARARNIHIHVECKTVITLWADRTRLKQVLINLISNAIKYNRKGGGILLSCARDEENNTGRILITDTGPGIPADRVAELFQPFIRLEAQDGLIEGTGIGLAVCKRLMDAMGGKIGLKSEMNKGSTFWIELPLDQEISPPAIQIALPVERATEVTDQSVTVLYVEDNEANLKLVSQVLARQRPHVRLLTATSPSLGMAIALAQQPDMILLDINLPGMNGYQILAELRAQATMTATPIIAVSANAMPADITRGKSAGFNDYLTKPIVIPRFLALIDALLEKKFNE